MQDTQVRSLGREDPREKEMATHSSILAWEIPWTEEPGGLQSMGHKGVGHNLATEQQQKEDLLINTDFHTATRASDTIKLQLFLLRREDGC